MSQQAIPHPDVNDELPDRAANGRFKKGNAGGAGNPFGRRLAALREAILRVVTPDVLEKIFAMLEKKASEGDVAATKLLLQYSVGKPKPMVEPDRVDLDEWDLAEQSWVDARRTTEMMTTGVPVGLANVMADAVASARTNDLGEMIIDPSKAPPVVSSTEDEEDDDTPLTPEEIEIAKREWSEFKARFEADPFTFEMLLAGASGPSLAGSNGPQPGCLNPQGGASTDRYSP